jgi:hypothetical protein
LKGIKSEAFSSPETGLQAHLIEFANFGGDDVIEQPVDRLVIVEHQEKLNQDWKAEKRKI